MWIEILPYQKPVEGMTVTSYAEVWIEINNYRQTVKEGGVTSYAEVWIEISASDKFINGYGSPPTRRCGLKCWINAANEVEKGHLLRGGVD